MLRTDVTYSYDLQKNCILFLTRKRAVSKLIIHTIHSVLFSFKLWVFLPRIQVMWHCVIISNTWWRCMALFRMRMIPQSAKLENIDAGSIFILIENIFSLTNCETIQQTLSSWNFDFQQRETGLILNAKEWLNHNLSLTEITV